MVSELKILNLAFRPLSDEDDGTLDTGSDGDPEEDGDDELGDEVVKEAAGNDDGDEPDLAAE